MDLEVFRLLDLPAELPGHTTAYGIPGCSFQKWRKKVNWGTVKVMAEWLHIGKEKVDSEWDEIEYLIEERCSRDPFETTPKRYLNGIERTPDGRVHFL